MSYCGKVFFSRKHEKHKIRMHSNLRKEIKLTEYIIAMQILHNIFGEIVQILVDKCAKMQLCMGVK